MAGNKPWQRGTGRRRSDILPRRRILIVCEDEKSSRYYFESFPVDRLRIPMKADTCSDSYRTLIRRYRTVVGAKRRS